ncbi:MAG: hypothetical protein P8I92_06815 [Schleiferiaceae bacterium]|nr:hypothetical protein [Schleiferiaceae bacterium]
MLECVANISEGRQTAIINDFESSLLCSPGINLINIHKGYDANRTVFTFLGDNKSITSAVIDLLRKCLIHIDMRKHLGNQPRIGSLDVCPIIPIPPSTIDDANECIQNILKEIEIQKIKVGGWLYRESSVNPKNYELSNVRKGQYEMLSQSRNKFDFGYFNPRFGAMALGVRNFLIAYNIHLGKNNAFQAKKIAGIIRESSATGIPGVKSIGWYCEHLGLSQVSCNIIDIDICTPKLVYDRVLIEAENLGITTYGSELIGMLPKIAFRDFDTSNQAMKYLKLDSISSIEIEERIIENYI